MIFFFSLNKNPLICVIRNADEKLVSLERSSLAFMTLHGNKKK